MEPRREREPSARRWLIVSRIISREIRWRTRVVVESLLPSLFGPPKSPADDEADSAVAVDRLEAAETEVGSVFTGKPGITRDPSELEDGVDAPISLEDFFTGDTTLAVFSSVLPTASSEISSNSKEGRRWGLSTFFSDPTTGGGVNGRPSRGVEVSSMSSSSVSELISEPETDPGEGGSCILVE